MRPRSDYSGSTVSVLTPPGSFGLFPHSAAGLEAMLSAIQKARRSIILEMYIFEADEIGFRFLDQLVAARKRGVRVQVLIDALGSISLPSSFWNPLVQAGGEFRWFNPFQVSTRYGCRNHRKLFVADHTVAIIGGFNVATEYMGDGVYSGWRDLGLEIHDPALIQALTDSFYSLFYQASEHPPAFPFPRKGHEAEIQGSDWTLLLTGPGRGHRALRRNLIKDLGRARRVEIICAYFIPTKRLRKALANVVRRGGSVTLILAGRSDVPSSRLATRSLYHRLMRSGVQIYEYEPQILHSKLFILDDILYVGSANLDARSLKINYELLLRLDDAATARQAHELFQADLAHSCRVDPATWQHSRSWWQRLKERLAYTFYAQIDPYFTSQKWHKRALKQLED